MTIIRVPIVRWVDTANPGWVECVLTDASGRQWSIIDKFPIFSNDMDMNKDSQYPQPGLLACEIVGEKVDGKGRKIAVVNTDKPWGVESIDGTTIFEVLHEQIEVV